MKAKRFVELRKKKMKQILVPPPPPVVKQRQPQPSPFKSLPFSRNKQQQQATTTKANANGGDIDCDVIIESSSTMSSLGGPPSPPDLPSTQIRNHFARTSQSYEDTLTENGNNNNINSVCYDADGSIVSTGSSYSRPGQTGRNRLQRAITERRVKTHEVCGHNNGNDDGEDNENKNSGPFPASKKELRSIYQQYLDGNVEKESVMRTGRQWTTGYRSRRFQEIQ